MWTWLVISFLIGTIGIINLFFVIDHPSKVGILIKEGDEGDVRAVANQVEHEIDLIENENNSRFDSDGEDGQRFYGASTEPDRQDDGQEGEQSIGFFKAWLIPGVIPFSV